MTVHGPGLASEYRVHVELLALRVDVVPLLLIVAGCGLLASSWRGRRSTATPAPPPRP